MKNIFSIAVLTLILSATPSFANAAAWKPAKPEGYTQISWAKAAGMATFFKAPSGNGLTDFITRIYLPQNQIGFIFNTSTEPIDRGTSETTFVPKQIVNNAVIANDENATTTEQTASTTTAVNYHNFAFERLVAEGAKSIQPLAKFIWNAPFFNITNAISDLSMAIKATFSTTTLISSGSRPENDMAQDRKMLIINNKKGTALIEDFNAERFVSSTLGDQALEGFAPTVAKSDGAGGAARLFIGVSTSSKELIIYCSQQATVNEASTALVAAGVPIESQMEADGGGSAACGYNLPGQYFVEPSRTLPLMMGATSILARGTATTQDTNVRSGPATTYSVVAKLKKGQAITAFEEKSGWFKIGDGQWVKKTLIKY
jgi:hypothetical protein